MSSKSWANAPAGDIWFVVVGDDGDGTEGGWGDVGGAERNGSTASGFCGNFDRYNAGSCPAPDVVNGQMIRHWCAAMGDSNPVYQDAEAAKNSIHGGIVAPPAMMNAWTMPPFVPPLVVVR